MGFGDFYPLSDFERILGAFVILFGVAIFSIIISEFLDLITNIQNMSVSEAVMRLDLSGENALMFKNPTHDGLNMVYRRTDGNIGWVDPQGNEQAMPKVANQK